MLIAMWVAPEARRRGVGRALVAGVMNWAAEIGLSRITLWVAEDNVAAWTLYEDLGFQQSDEREPLPSDPSRQITRFDLVLPSNA